MLKKEINLGIKELIDALLDGEYDFYVYDHYDKKIVRFSPKLGRGYFYSYIDVMSRKDGKGYIAKESSRGEKGLNYSLEEVLDMYENCLKYFNPLTDEEIE